MKCIKGTRIYSVLEDKREYQEGLALGVSILRRGGLVAFPTETVYGLGADGLNGAAVLDIFTVKGRPNDNPLILHIDSLEKVQELVEEIPSQAEPLMEEYWPGPLTLVFSKAPHIPHQVTAGRKTVALRFPASQVALDLIRSSGLPLAAPSANLSGRPSPTTAQHVLSDLAGRIPLILDGGPTGIGLESTVLDVTRDPPLLLRPGGITLEELERILGRVELEKGVKATFPQLVQRVSSPGMKYTHYAPKTPLILVEGFGEAAVALLLKKAQEYRGQGKKVGIMAPQEEARIYQEEGFLVWEIGKEADLEGVSQLLFALIREMDGAGLDIILARGFHETGMGLAIMNRLRRAAGYRILTP